MTATANLFQPLSGKSESEVSSILAEGNRFRLKRIVSTGQATPAGEWYDEPTTEWVVMLSGAATLRFEVDDREVRLQPGDYLEIQPHCRHRVEWTTPDEETVWLAVYYDGDE